MLDAGLKAQLATYLGRVTQPVALVSSLDDRPASQEMRALLEHAAVVLGPTPRCLLFAGGDRGTSMLLDVTRSELRDLLRIFQRVRVLDLLRRVVYGAHHDSMKLIECFESLHPALRELFDVT